MDFIQECLQERGEALMGELEIAGFSQDQATNFLPTAASVILKSTQNPGATQSIRDLLENPAELIGSIDVDEISKSLGIERTQVTTGFEAITPVFCEFYTLSNGGIVYSVVSLIAGGYR